MNLIEAIQEVAEGQPFEDAVALENYCENELSREAFQALVTLSFDKMGMVEMLIKSKCIKVDSLFILRYKNACYEIEHYTGHFIAKVDVSSNLGVTAELAKSIAEQIIKSLDEKIKLETE
jgi:hypothetical protein